MMMMADGGQREREREDEVRPAVMHAPRFAQRKRSWALCRGCGLRLEGTCAPHFNALFCTIFSI